MNDLRIWLHNFWLRFNGDLTSSLSTLALIVAVAGLVVFVVVDNLTADGEFTPLGGYNNPQPLAEHTVPVGGSIVTLLVIKCNESDEPVSVRGERFWRRLDNGGQVSIPDGGGTATFEPGCKVRGSPEGANGVAFTNPLLPEIGPGTWVLQGQDCAVKGSQKHCVNWRTEEFQVVEAQ